MWVDSDWANDEISRRSTSGGIVRRGEHSVAWWSRKQSRVALLSCEAELSAIVKGLAEGKLLNGVCELFEEPCNLEVVTDSSAAKGVVLRSGAGKLKHLSVKQLWVQEFITEEKVKVSKTPRELNPADGLTHSWSVSDGRFFLWTGFANFDTS